MAEPDVLIVGAGLAGLCCARKLHQQGVSFRIVEASTSVGGRVRTDKQNGFILDHGFQVLLTAYPEALEQLDYEALQLCPFAPGAMVRHEGRFYRLTDPWREPGTVLSALFSPIGSFGDKLRMARLRHDVLKRSIGQIFAGEEMSTMQALRRRRFSHRIIERFFRPLIGGATLDPKLTVSNRMFEFVFRMLAEGDAAVPAAGMQAIPDQLAASLPAASILFEHTVHALGEQKVTLDTGEVLNAQNIVVAAEGPEAGRLLNSERGTASRSACCLYFAAKEPPIEEPILVLSGSSRGPINSVAVMNLVAPGYAPGGDFLISVTILGWPSRDDTSLARMVRNQLKRWYGLVAEDWKLLRLYRMEHALPVLSPLEWERPARVKPGVYVCGDHRATPSIQGAMVSGRLAAEALLRDMKGEPDPERDQAETRHPTHG